MAALGFCFAIMLKHALSLSMWYSLIQAFCVLVGVDLKLENPITQFKSCIFLGNGRLMGHIESQQSMLVP